MRSSQRADKENGAPRSSPDAPASVPSCWLITAFPACVILPQMNHQPMCIWMVKPPFTQYISFEHFDGKNPNKRGTTQKVKGRKFLIAHGGQYKLFTVLFDSFSFKKKNDYLFSRPSRFPSSPPNRRRSGSGRSGRGSGLWMDASINASWLLQGARLLTLRQ